VRDIIKERIKKKIIDFRFKITLKISRTQHNQESRFNTALIEPNQARRWRTARREAPSQSRSLKL
jgi:hypothetical protein